MLFFSAVGASVAHGAVVSTASSSAPVVGIAITPSGDGYWLAHRDGTVENSGDAKHHGGMTGSADAVVAIAAMPAGSGYWLTTASGKVRAFGNARTYGDGRSFDLSAPIVAMAPTAAGNGYWLVGADSGILSFGAAKYYGSTANLRLSGPIVGIAVAGGGGGYWLVGSDGGIFSFGSANFYGSTGGLSLDAPIIDMRAAANGAGYLLVASDGGIFSFGAVAFHGSLGRTGIADVVDVATDPGGSGYRLATARGHVARFGPPTKPAPSGASLYAPGGVSTIAAELFNRMNAERRVRGLEPLWWDTTLANTASSWAHAMAQAGFEHSALSRTLTSFDGSYLAMAENIYRGDTAYADAGSAHLALMESSGHRRTMLESAYTVVGIGVYCTAGGELWVTQQFAAPAAHGSPKFAGGRPANPVVADNSAGAGC